MNAIVFSVLAKAFEYPSPGYLETLEQQVQSLDDDRVKRLLQAFLAKIGRLSLAEWEVLYTETLDLSPSVAPYVGFQTWGESYQRGEFMARLSQVYREAQVDQQGELPDHLLPVLKYLAVEAQPLPELLEVLEPALERMVATLHKREPGNPYLDWFEACREALRLNSKRLTEKNF